jgi:enamine deaminase RidA (YjgF/YER057c/UK114 family)
MNDADVMQRLSDLGFELPPPPQPVAVYVPVVVSGSLAFVAGQVPTQGGAVMHPGRLGEGVVVEEAQASARRAALQALSVLRAALGSFGPLTGIVQVTVYVAATPAFSEHAQVANGASELLVEVLGEPGHHARAAIGVASLPLGSCVEVAVTAEVAPPGGG